MRFGWNGVAVLVVTVFAATSACAGAKSMVNKIWAKYDDSWDGVFTDPNHWPDTTMPGSGERAYVQSQNGLDMLITFPSETLNLLCVPIAQIKYANTSVTFDGSETTLKLPDTGTDENWPADPFYVNYDTKAMLDLSIYNCKNFSNAVYTASNFKLMLSTDADKSPTASFEKGSFNAYDPDGFPRLGGTTPSRFYIFHGLADYSPLPPYAKMSIGPGVTMRLPEVYLQSGTHTNILEVDGGNLQVCKAMSIPGNVNYRSSGERTELILKNGATNTMDGSVTVGGNNSTYGLTTANSYRILADGKGTKLSVNGSFRTRYGGTFDVDILNGAAFRFGENGAGGDCVFSREGATTTTVTVVDSKVDFPSGYMNLGPNTLTDAGATWTRLYATNSTINLAAGQLTLKGDYNELELVDSSLSATIFAFGSLAIPGSQTKVMFRGSTVTGTQNQAMTVGPAVLDTGILPQTHVYATNSVITSAGGLTVYGDDEEVELVDTTATFGSSVYLGSHQRGDGCARLVLRGGSFTQSKVKSQHTYVGNGGNASLYVDGGDHSFGNNLYVGSKAGASNSATGRLDIVAGRVTVYDTVRLGNEATKTYGILNITGGALCATNVSVGLARPAEATVSGGVLNVFQYLHLGNNSTSPTAEACTNVLTVTGGIVSNNMTGAAVYVGYSDNTYGILNVSGGESYFNSFYTGWYGASEVNVSGGYVKVPQDTRIGASTPGVSAASYEWTDVFRVTGGVFDNSKKTFEAAYNTNGRKVKIILDGGEVRAQHFRGKNTLAGGGGSTAVLEADGGKFVSVPNYTSTALDFSKFDSAKLGPKGLILVADNAANITQGFANKDDESGLLALDGAGTKTLKGVYTVDTIDVRGGSVVFDATSTVASKLVLTNGAEVTVPPAIASAGTLKGLVLGSAAHIAHLTIDSGSPFRVDGDLEFVNFRLDLTGTYELDNAYELFTCTGAISEDSLLAFKRAIISSGLGADKAYDMVVTTDEQGVSHLTMNVREPREYVIRVDHGDDEAASNITYAVSDTLKTIVAADASLQLSGNFGDGRLIKEGEGLTRLVNSKNCYLGGVYHREGALGFDYPESSVLFPYLFNFDAAASNVVLTCDVAADKRVTLSEFKGGTGSLRKTGAGELVIRDIPKKVTLSGNVGTATADFVINVEAGALVVDNAKLSAGAGFIKVPYYTGPVSGEIPPATLVVSNKAEVTANTVQLLALNCAKNPNLKAKILVDDAILNSTYTHEFNYNVTGCDPAEIELRNGAILYGNEHFRGNVNFTADHATIMRDASRETTLVVYGTGGFMVDMLFANQTVFKCAALQSYEGQGDDPSVLRLTFDDSEWWSAATEYTIENPVINKVADRGVKKQVKLDLVMRGKGLVLDLDETKTWTIAADATGEGGMVKRGAGTLVLPGEHQQFKGALVVEDGTVDLDGTATAGRFAGAGTIRNGSLVRATLEVDAAAGDENVLTLDGVTVSGRNKVDLGGANLPVGATLTVANYTGTEPNVSNWKLVGNGETSGTFTAAGGVITAEVTPKGGMLLIVR